MTDAIRFLPAGDLAVVVELGDEISIAVNRRVRALEFLLGEARLPGVVETVPSFRSLLVYYDPGAVSYDALCAAIRDVAAQTERTALPASRRVELPCCYDPEFGSDLSAAGARLGLDVDELIRVHAAGDYVVYFIGFTPGLPYMTLPDRLHIARLDTPRTHVPAGSVGIGGAQCCVYSVDSPGGFWLLGRTPLRLYDPDAAEPTLLRPGDHVRMRPIARDEFDAIADAVAAHAYAPVIA